MITVQGKEIPDEQVTACIERMRKPGVWCASSIEAAAEAAGVPWGQLSMRLADRLIQRERKAGRIIQVKRGWWEWRARNGGPSQ